MKRNAWNKPHSEEMRRRFLQCGIAVNDPESEESNGGLIICPDSSRFDCRATVHYPGHTRYTLRLRLISNDPNRVLSAFTITSAWEKEIRVLEPFERVPEKYVDWSPEEDILNNRVGQTVGQTRCREGMLLAEGLKIPTTDGPNFSASITVCVYDQFNQVYSQSVSLDLIGLHELMAERNKPRQARESLFEHPLDVPEIETNRDWSADGDRLDEAGKERKVIPSNPKRAPASRKGDEVEQSR